MRFEGNLEKRLVFPNNYLFCEWSVVEWVWGLQINIKKRIGFSVDIIYITMKPWVSPGTVNVPEEP